MKLVQLSLIPVLLVMQSACQFKLGAQPQSKQRTPSQSSQPARASSDKLAGPEYEAYSKEVRKQWANNNYDWLETEAKRLRETKERLPGGYWKLRVLYRSVETVVSAESSDESWEEHIARVENWIKQRPTSIMPRIVLAEVWRTYAWKVRGTGFSDTVKRENWKPFHERLDKANEVLAEASKLGEQCPEWYLAALLAARGHNTERATFEAIYEQGVALEPTYYYLYQAKAGYLLPRWNGQPGEWERYAEIAANKVGGEQGDIILFTIYSDMMNYHDFQFMNEHQAIAPRLILGFRAIDKLYGASPQRLNEACLISFFAGDNKTPAELMNRIGDNYDVSVWKDESMFNVFRQEALMRIGELPRHRQSGSQR
jgi:hypothetical protein